MDSHEFVELGNHIPVVREKERLECKAIQTCTTTYHIFVQIDTAASVSGFVLRCCNIASRGVT